MGIYGSILDCYIHVHASSDSFVKYSGTYLVTVLRPTTIILKVLCLALDTYK